MSSLERILGFYLDSLLKESKRLAKIKGISFGLEILKGWRKITLFYFFAIIACLVFTASLFSALIFNINYYYLPGATNLFVFNLVTLGIGLLSLVFIFFALREKTWIVAFDLKNRFSQLNIAEKSSREKSNGLNIDEEQLYRQLEKSIEEKLDQLLDERFKTQKSESSNLKHTAS